MGIYLFIDGGYLREDYAIPVEPWFGSKGEIDFEAIVKRFVPTRSFYYDAAEDDQDSRVFSSIQERAGCVLRLGSLKGKKKTQKKVDMMLALDMVNHAIRKNMFKAVLLAGDHDFEPVVRTVSDLGIPVEVVADSRSRSRDLTNAADKFVPLTFLDYWNWSTQELKNQFPIPQIGGMTVSDQWKVIATGRAGGVPCKFFNPGKTFWCMSIYKDAVPLVITAGPWTIEAKNVSDEQLKLFCKLQYGEVEWD